MSCDRIDLSHLRVFPLAERRHLSRLDDVLIDPSTPPPPVSAELAASLDACAAAIASARARGAGVMLIYGAHLLRNGAARLLSELMAGGHITHLATNGAGSIHDWEFSFQAKTSESVRENVATGTFGTWRETGDALNLALLVGGARGDGYGQALGRFIAGDGVDVPTAAELRARLATMADDDPLLPAVAELLVAVTSRGLPTGRVDVAHAWKHASVAAEAFRLGVPWTVHPGIGYDIIACHPWYSGAAVGRAANVDFARYGAAVDTLDGGVALNIGTAIMEPQVFEKSLSCVNNLRLQAGRPTVSGHSIYVVDLQDGGGWDWNQGEPPKTSAAYYLRFCKSFARMGGALSYVQADNATFVHHLWTRLSGA